MLRVYTDSDWASCETTRKSRSGGVLTYHGKTLMHFCRHQNSIALSSGEAELKAACKGLAEGIGLRVVIEFLTDAPCPMDHVTDASACRGILMRRGSAGVKHLTVRELWVQELMTQPLTTCTKIARADNPADMLCSVPSVASLKRHMCTLRCRHC